MNNNYNKNNYNLTGKIYTINEEVVDSKSFSFGLTTCINILVWLVVSTSWYGYDLEYNGKIYSAPMANENVLMVKKSKSFINWSFFANALIMQITKYACPLIF